MREVQYYRCGECGFIRTEDPDWLEQAYASPITASDIGLVRRNLMAARVTAGVILAGFDPHARFLDEGGGYGLFVRLMRDQGFDFRRSDPFCENLFAAGFDAGDEVGFELLTAFEVFEHFVDPDAELERLHVRAGAILLSTTLLPDPVPMPPDWPYFGCEHGQHLSFYTAEALRRLAQRHGLVATPGPRGFHLLTRQPVRPWVRLALRPRAGMLLAGALGPVRGVRSLQEQDQDVVARGRGEGVA